MKKIIAQTLIIALGITGVYFATSRASVGTIPLETHHHSGVGQAG